MMKRGAFEVGGAVPARDSPAGLPFLRSVAAAVAGARCLPPPTRAARRLPSSPLPSKPKDGKERKLSKVQAAKKLRSGAKSA